MDPEVKSLMEAAETVFRVSGAPCACPTAAPARSQQPLKHTRAVPCQTHGPCMLTHARAEPQRATKSSQCKALTAVRPCSGGYISLSEHLSKSSHDRERLTMVWFDVRVGHRRGCERVHAAHRLLPLPDARHAHRGQPVPRRGHAPGGCPAGGIRPGPFIPVCHAGKQCLIKC
jgi:hypothetical protein